MSNLVPLGGEGLFILILILGGEGMTKEDAAKDSVNINLRKTLMPNKNRRFPPHPALPYLDSPPASFPGLSETPRRCPCPPSSSQDPLLFPPSDPAPLVFPHPKNISMSESGDPPGF